MKNIDFILTLIDRHRQELTTLYADYLRDSQLICSRKTHEAFDKLISSLNSDINTCDSSVKLLDSMRLYCVYITSFPFDTLEKNIEELKPFVLVSRYEIPEMLDEFVKQDYKTQWFKICTDRGSAEKIATAMQAIGFQIELRPLRE